jgi:DNA-binding response OmpR family regulator
VAEGKSVLIVEDDPDIARTLQIRLQGIGVKVQIAYDADSAARLAHQGQPDLVLLDVALPDGNGFEVADQVRTLVSAATPLIFITANGRADIRRMAEAYKPVAFFAKPYQPDELISTICSAL